MIVPRWEPDFPADVRAIVEPVLTDCLWLVPTWCQEFIVRYAPHVDARMQTEVSHRNRWAILMVTGQWLNEPADERTTTLTHELAHLVLEPFAVAANRVKDRLSGDAQGLADDMLRDGLECAVEDLARCLTRLRNATR